MSSDREHLGLHVSREHQINEIIERLGQPAVLSGSALIYQADCVPALKALANFGIPLTVTSPPYNIGKEYEQALPLPEYLSWCEEWLAGIHAATSTTGALWLNLGYVAVPGRGKAVPLPYLMWDRTEFFLRQEVVWTYGAGVAARHGLSPRNEKFLWYSKDPSNYTFNLDEIRDPDVKYPNQKKNGKIRVNPLGKNPGDVWALPKVTSGANRSSPERTPHPAQFPEAVIERIIRASSNPGDIVVDPFSGSGTTALVARRLGRIGVGFELEQRYVDVSGKRLDNHLELFGDELAS